MRKSVVFFKYDPDEMDLSAKKNNRKGAPERAIRWRKNSSGNKDKYKTQDFTVNFKDTRQNCILKTSYKNLTPWGKAASKAHVRYITRNGTEKDGKSRAKVFGSVSKKEITQFKPNEERQFRFVLSPENGSQIDMKEFTKHFMNQIEQYIDQKLRWIAVCHYNTGQPHSHIIISGVDQIGQDVWFDRDDLRHNFRNMARQDLTKLIGRNYYPTRTGWENHHIKTPGFTPLDQKIADLVKCLPSKKDLNYDWMSKLHSKSQFTTLVKRLNYLKRLNLVKTNGSSYLLDNNWIKKLRSMNNFHNYTLAAKKLKYNKTLELYQQEKHGKIIGQVAWAGMRDENGNVQAIAVETIHGKSIFIKDYRALAGLKNGDVISYNENRKNRLNRLSLGQIEAIKGNNRNLKGFGKIIGLGGDFGQER